MIIFFNIKKNQEMIDFEYIYIYMCAYPHIDMQPYC